MKRLLSLSLACLPALLLAPRLQAEKPRPLAGGPPGGPAVVLVGRITSSPSQLAREKKMQVGVGPDRTAYTVHFAAARLTGLYGQALGYRDLHHGQWVRAEGRVMRDPRRIEAERVQVIGRSDFDFRRSAFSRLGCEQGCLQPAESAPTAAAPPAEGATGSVERRLTLVGRVTDDTHPLAITRKIQVDAAGNQWTLSVPSDAAVVDDRGRQVSLHRVRKREWVVVSGEQTDDLRMQVSRLREIGPEDAYRKSVFYRAEWPRGYVETVSAAPGDVVEGTVTAIDRTAGYVVVRDADGKERRIFTGQETASRLNVGDPVRVRSR